MSLYFIQCRWQANEHDPVVQGFAVCSNADTPVTFLHADGSPYTGDDIWDYLLEHSYPWAKLGDER